MWVPALGCSLVNCQSVTGMSTFRTAFVAGLAAIPDALPLSEPPFVNKWFEEHEKFLELALSFADGRILRGVLVDLVCSKIGCSWFLFVEVSLYTWTIPPCAVQLLGS